METIQEENIYARSQVELFLDEEESSLEDDKSFGNIAIKEIMEGSEDDGNNTETQRRLGIDINMIGAREKLWEGQEVKQKNYHPQQMNPWKEQI